MQNMPFCWNWEHSTEALSISQRTIHVLFLRYREIVLLGHIQLRWRRFRWIWPGISEHREAEPVLQGIVRRSGESCCPTSWVLPFLVIFFLLRFFLAFRYYLRFNQLWCFGCFKSIDSATRTRAYIIHISKAFQTDVNPRSTSPNWLWLSRKIEQLIAIILCLALGWWRYPRQNGSQTTERDFVYDSRLAPWWQGLRQHLSLRHLIEIFGRGGIDDSLSVWDNMETFYI